MRNTGEEAQYRNRADQTLVVGMTVVALLGMAWQFSQPSAGTVVGDLAFAGVFALIGWFGYRLGVRAHVAVSQGWIHVVNPVVTTSFPISVCDTIRSDALSLVFELHDRRTVRAWGASSSALNRLQRLPGAISSELVKQGTPIAEPPHRGRAVRTRIRPEAWVFVLVFAFFAAEIAVRRALS